MRHGDCTGLFRVVYKIALRVFIGGLADNFNAVLVRADGAIAAKSVKNGLKRILVCIGSEALVPVQAGVCYIIENTDREMVFWLWFSQFIKYRLDHRRGEFLGGQAIAPTDNGGQLAEPVLVFLAAICKVALS